MLVTHFDDLYMSNLHSHIYCHLQSYRNLALNIGPQEVRYLVIRTEILS